MTETDIPHRDQIGGAMKASDITDLKFLDAMRVALELRPSNIGVTRWDVGAVLDGNLDYVREQGEADRRGNGWATEIPEAVIPRKVILAKARRLIERGVIAGCACGCRGDFEMILPRPGKEPRTP